MSTPTTGQIPPAGAGTDARGAPRRRPVLWISAAVGVAVAVLVGVLAVVGSPSDTSRLVGQPAPAIEGTTVAGGRHVSLSQYAGGWVVVDFGATWCSGCRQELPALRRFAATAAEHHTTVLTVDEQPSDATALSRYMRANHADWPVVRDQQATLSYGVQTIPAIYLIDPVGYVYAFYPAGIDPTSLDATITAAIRAEGGGA